MRGNTISIELPLKRGKVSKTIPLYQYDYGQKLLITGAELPEYYEVHFSNEMHGEAVTSIGDSTGVLIPDDLLETGENVYLWLYLHADSNDGETEFQGVIPVIKRSKATDQTPTPAEQSVITQAIAALTAASAEATVAKEDAEAAQQHIENMGVAATTLPTDSDATVTKTVNASGEVLLTFGLPRGVKGDRGDRGLQGETGNDGEDGEDGFSPVVSLTKSGKVTTFSVTDAEDTYSVEINDGEDGNPGQDATPDLITVDYSDLTFPVAAGTMCYHSGLLYKANQAIATSEEWTAAHWTQTTIEEEYLSLKTEINSKADEPTGTKSAGKVYGLDSNLNPAWVDGGGGGSFDPQDIAQAVADWCEENITEDPTVVIDKSLLVEGAAADSEAVGKAIKPFTDELAMQSKTIDLLATAKHYAGKKIDPDGAIQNVSTYDVYEIAYDGTYEKFDAVLYSSSNYLLRAMTFHDANDIALETDEFLNTTGDYKSTFTNKTIPTGTKTIYLSYRNSMGPVSASAVVKKSERLTEMETDIDTIKNKVSVFPVSSKNLFDARKQVVGLIYEANGTLIDSYENHRASDYIEVEPDTIYTISAYYKSSGLFGISGLRYAFYTSSKVFISGAKPEGAWSTFRTPSNAAYIRFSMYVTEVEKFQLERRSFATNYVPFGAIAEDDESDEMFLNYMHKIYTANGLEYNFYLFNVLPERYEGQFHHGYKENNTKLIDYGRFLRMRDSNNTTSDIPVIAYAKDSTKYGAKIFTIAPCNQTNLDNVSVLILGDSTTANGYVAQYLHEFEGNESKITTLGTLGTAPYKHEGRSGWRLSMYFTESTNNPFYNPSTQTFDAEYYFNQTGVDVPDLFIINLGINDMHYSSDSLADAKQTADTYVSMVNTVIESLRNVDANMKVAICLTIPPNVDPWGFGAAGTNIIAYDAYRIANLVLCEKLIDAFDCRESEGLYLIPINASLDTKYNMPTSAQLPNSRASETIIKPSDAGNVHPNASGYHQIADVIYAFLCGTFKTT